jgi:hypothetical protein
VHCVVAWLRFVLTVSRQSRTNTKCMDSMKAHWGPSCSVARWLVSSAPSQTGRFWYQLLACRSARVAAAVMQCVQRLLQHFPAHTLYSARVRASAAPTMLPSCTALVMPPLAVCASGAAARDLAATGGSVVEVDGWVSRVCAACSSQILLACAAVQLQSLRLQLLLGNKLIGTSCSAGQMSAASRWPSCSSTTALVYVCAAA